LENNDLLKNPKWQKIMKMLSGNQTDDLDDSTTTTGIETGKKTRTGNQKDDNTTTTSVSKKV
jgi:hypothetical protein